MKSYIILLISLLLLAGCVNITPKLRTELKAEMRAEMNTELTAHMENAAVKLSTTMEAKFGDIKTEMTQDFANSKVQQNIGLFSGGAIYVTVVAVVVIIMGGLLWRSNKKGTEHAGVLEGIGSAIHELSCSGGSKHANEVKKEIKKNLKRAGLSSMFDELLKAKGLYTKITGE